MSKEDNAAELFESSGFNCAQSLLATYGPAMGLDRETALNMSSVLCGGIARMGKTCGSVTGALIVLGLKYTKSGAPDNESKAEIYDLTQKFLSEFRNRNKSTECTELLGFSVDMKYIDPDVLSGIKKKCQKYVRDAAEIIEEMMKGDKG